MNTYNITSSKRIRLHNRNTRLSISVLIIFAILAILAETIELESRRAFTRELSRRSQAHIQELTSRLFAPQVRQPSRRTRSESDT